MSARVAFLLVACAACRKEPARTLPSLCESIVAEVIAGRALPPAASHLEAAARLVYECRVVESDDASACYHFPVETRANCIARHTFWHRARTRDVATPWERVMAAGIADECRNPTNHVSPATCARMVEAISAADPARCSSLDGALKPMCRGIAGADPSVCAGDRDCQALALRLQLLRQGGLERVAQAGSEVDRAHAAAALGRPGACLPFIERLRSSCAEPRPAPK